MSLTPSELESKIAIRMISIFCDAYERCQPISPEKAKRRAIRELEPELREAAKQKPAKPKPPSPRKDGLSEMIDSLDVSALRERLRCSEEGKGSSPPRHRKPSSASNQEPPTGERSLEEPLYRIKTKGGQYLGVRTVPEQEIEAAGIRIWPATTAHTPRYREVMRSDGRKVLRRMEPGE